jgi:phage-related protein
MSFGLTLTDDNGSVYTFPENFSNWQGSLAARTNVKNHVHADGGKQTGDGRYSSRALVVSGAIFADTQAAFETALRAMTKAVIKGGLLKITSDQVSRYIDVRKPNIDYEIKRLPAFIRITLTFVAQYPFWLDVSETSSAHVMTGNGTFTVDASGSDYIMTPTIVIAADQGVDVPGVKFKNITDGSMYFQFNSPAFLAGSTLTMDCSNGTVKLNNTDAIEYLVAPSSFLRLQNMVNTFDYEGAACTITIKYRKVYAI